MAGIWITSAFIALIPLVWKNSQSCRVCFLTHSSVCLVLVFAVPYAFMIYAYVVMFKVITSKRRPSSTHSATSRLHKKSINDRKCILVFALMAAIFAFCWLPYFTIALVLNINQYFRLDISEPIIFKVTEVFAFVRYTTSVTNPLLYTFFKRDFWQALRNLHLKREYSHRRTSSNSRDPPALRDTLTSPKRFFESTVLSRLSWAGEFQTTAINNPEINTAEEQIVFISSV